MDLHDRRHSRAATAGIWALVLIFAIIQVVAGTLGGDASLRPIVMLRIFSAWVVVFTLAIISTRRIGGLARTMSSRSTRAPQRSIRSNSSR